MEGLINKDVKKARRKQHERTRKFSVQNYRLNIFKLVMVANIPVLPP